MFESLPPDWRAGAETDEEAALLERALKDLNLNPLYEKQLLSKSIAYYQKKASQEEKGGADLAIC